MTPESLYNARRTLGEDWRDVPGLDGYQVSSSGEVRSVTRLKVYANGGARWLYGRTLKTWLAEGYPQVELAGRSYHVHRLVLEAFAGPCPEGHECAHNDGDRQNSRLSNLRWATRKDNHADKQRHGTVFRPTGELGTAAKLKAEQVAEIRRIGRSESQKSLAARYGVRQQQISRILRREQWR